MLSFSPPSPVKFAGDCWHAGSPLAVCTSLAPPGEQPMEEMDVTASSEASAPLPIRPPAGTPLGQFKQQAYPVVAKRPEHLRMNL